MMSKSEVSLKFFYLTVILSLILVIVAFPVRSDTENIQKEVNDPTPNIGDIITYTITVIQTNPDWGNVIQVTDILPDQVSYVSHTADPDTDVTVTGQEVFWWSDNYPQFPGHIPMPKGKTRVLTINAQVIGCGSGIVNIAEVTSSPPPQPPAQPGDIEVGEQGDATIDVECLPTQNIFKEVDNPTPSIGDNITYTVILVQTSAVEGNMVQVTDTLPVEVAYVSHSAPAGTTVEVSGQTILWKGTNPAGLIPVPVGATVALDITVEVVDCGDGIVNLAEVTASQGAGDISVGEQATAIIDVECPPTQNIFKDVDNPTPSIGDNITYTITLVQTNPTTGNVVQVTDWLPDEVAYVSHVADPDTIVEVDGQEVFWYGNYPEYEDHIPMPIGKTRQLQLVVELVSYGKGIENLAEVTSSRGDGDIETGEQATVTIDAFNILKEVDNPTPYRGDNITYTITLKQRSAVEGNMVQVTDILPAEMVYVSHSAPPGTTVEVSGQTILWKGDNPAGLIPVPVGAIVALEITVETIEYGKGIENTAKVTASQGGGDIRLNDQATVSIDILHILEITWNLTHDWSVTAADSAGNEGVNPLGETLLSITMYNDRFGWFETGDGYDGLVLYDSVKNTVWLIFRTGCEPIYYSRDFDGVGYMSGRMRCRTGPGSGTWEATKQ